MEIIECEFYIFILDIQDSTEKQIVFHRTVISMCYKYIRRRADHLSPSDRYWLFNDHSWLISIARYCAPLRVHFSPFLVCGARNSAGRQDALFLVFLIRVVHLVVD